MTNQWCCMCSECSNVEVGESEEEMIDVADDWRLEGCPSCDARHSAEVSEFD